MFNMDKGMDFTVKWNLSKEAGQELAALLIEAVKSGGGKTEPVVRDEEGDFEFFWKMYPRKVAVGAARKAWVATAKKRPPVENIVLALEDQMNAEDGLSAERQYMPHASTWLRAERWSDELEVRTGTSGRPASERLAELKIKRDAERAATNKNLGKQLGDHFEKGNRK